ncbi:MAG: zinc ribbon domain-containing protein [Ardenticatenaceae bacterium]|nr:zinc ribbon domain-containing protein [Ardenticatenaceae bacterium]
MAIGSILVGVALLVLVGIFIARPFLRPQERPVALTEQQQLLEEKEAILDQIQALDFDHETGKIPTEVHALQRERLMAEATAVLQELDAAGGDPTYVFAEAEDMASPDVTPSLDVDTDIEIEAAIARMRQQRSQAPVAAAVAAATVSNGHARFCPQCGTPIDPGDRFCAHCGHNLTLTTSTKTA